MTKFQRRRAAIAKWAKGLERRGYTLWFGEVPEVWKDDLLQWGAEATDAFPFVADLTVKHVPDLQGAPLQHANRVLKCRHKPSRVEFFHEFGHHLDATVMDVLSTDSGSLTMNIHGFQKMPPWDQKKYARWFKQYIGLPKTNWAPATSLGLTHLQKPNEMFAEAVAAALMGRKKGVIVSFAWGKKRKALRLVKAMMR